MKRYYIKNKDKIKIKKDIYYNNNKEAYYLWHKKYVLENTEKVKEYGRNYSRVYVKNRYNNEPLYKLKRNLRSSTIRAYKNISLIKNITTEILLGCSYEDFKIYLESKFEDWMTHDNYGMYKKNTYNYGWDIDHIIPLSYAKTEEELIKLFHYTNLQPLCSKINRDIKKDNIL